MKPSTYVKMHHDLQTLTRYIEILKKKVEMFYMKNPISQIKTLKILRYRIDQSEIEHEILKNRVYKNTTMTKIT